MMKLLFLTLSLIPIAALSDNNTFLAGDESFLSINDPYRQAESWAVCSVAYDMMAKLQSAENPSMAQQLSNTARGAKVAIMMSQMTHLITNDNNLHNTPEKFNNTWTMSKLMSESLPETASVAILGEFERASQIGEVESAFEKLTDTFVVCSNNITAQQFYIDQWREMVKQGLLSMPE